DAFVAVENAQAQQEFDDDPAAAYKEAFQQNEENKKAHAETLQAEKFEADVQAAIDGELGYDDASPEVREEATRRVQVEADTAPIDYIVDAIKDRFGVDLTELKNF